MTNDRHPPWPADITHLTFDCFGTLIDWERGILAAVQPLLGAAAPENILRSYVRHEARLEASGWQPYRDILREVVSAMANDFGVALPASQRNVLVDSLPDWPPFPDTVAALQELATHFPLAILSNVDDELFAETRKRLPIQFLTVVTAQQVRSYKPAAAHFHEARNRLNVSPSQILHVAQSLYHDHVPARRMGFRTAWVTRPSLLTNTGLAPAANVKPDLVYPDLAALAARFRPKSPVDLARACF